MGKNMLHQKVITSEHVPFGNFHRRHFSLQDYKTGVMDNIIAFLASYRAMAIDVQEEMHAIRQASFFFSKVTRSAFKPSCQGSDASTKPRMFESSRPSWHLRVHCTCTVYTAAHATRGMIQISSVRCDSLVADQARTRRYIE